MRGNDLIQNKAKNIYMFFICFHPSLLFFLKAWKESDFLEWVLFLGQMKVTFLKISSTQWGWDSF